MMTVTTSVHFLPESSFTESLLHAVVGFFPQGFLCCSGDWKFWCGFAPKRWSTCLCSVQGFKTDCSNKMRFPQCSNWLESLNCECNCFWIVFEHWSAAIQTSLSCTYAFCEWTAFFLPWRVSRIWYFVHMVATFVPKPFHDPGIEVICQGSCNYLFSRDFNEVSFMSSNKRQPLSWETRDNCLPECIELNEMDCVSKESLFPAMQKCKLWRSSCFI